VKANVIVFEATIGVLFLVFYWGSSRAMGKSRNRGFFIGALAYSLAIQTVAVACGVMNFYWYSINNYYTTYPLGGYVIWLGLVPLSACLLWYMVAAVSQMLSAALASRLNVWWRSVIAGGIAVAFYALIEPVAVTNHWWTFNLKSFYIIDIPLVALFGVFASVFLFNLVYTWTILEPKDTKKLKKFEDATIKRFFKSNRHAANLNWRQLEWLFLYRLLVSLAAFGVFMAPVIVVFWLIANRGQIPPGW
jgi:hypothetical protein